MMIPRFKIESNQVGMKEACQNLGVRSIFSPTVDSGIGEIFENNPQLFVSDISQDAFLQFDEVGTEAAAKTKVEMEVLGLPPSKQKPNKKFIADRPFMFFLVDHAGMMYFAGQISKPEWEGEGDSEDK